MADTAREDYAIVTFMAYQLIFPQREKEDQGKRGCGLNMSSPQRATFNPPPFASMVPINTLLPPSQDATDSERDRRKPGVMEILRATTDSTMDISAPSTVGIVKFQSHGRGQRF
ncbi:unnamed protein product [Pleuronectes platessa]|uniref:Uncharacterized protein n=1 Tax=Pleuronectes platessa TaxID=8262 RepID=A0A9N7UEK8_PLEPL|nr:unnamed protein product [Pleuronectes platessa]